MLSGSTCSVNGAVNMPTSIQSQRCWLIVRALSGSASRATNSTSATTKEATTVARADPVAPPVGTPAGQQQERRAGGRDRQEQGASG